MSARRIGLASALLISVWEAALRPPRMTRTLLARTVPRPPASRPLERSLPQDVT
jgi:hypothetical protein